jgi:(p)ppGpp synthase/HD superfamily hydrolase
LQDRRLPVTNERDLKTNERDPKLDASGTELIARADRLCEEAHAGQFDKAGNPYVEHPRRAASYVDAGNVRAVAAALLHDVLEDSSLTAAEVAAEGIPHDVIEIVELLTRSPDVPDDEYYRCIRGRPDALEAKLADLADNTDPARMALLEPSDRERLTSKYAAAYAQLGVDAADGDKRRRAH